MERLKEIEKKRARSKEIIELLTVDHAKGWRKVKRSEVRDVCPIPGVHDRSGDWIRAWSLESLMRETEPTQVEIGGWCVCESQEATWETWNYTAQPISEEACPVKIAVLKAQK